MSMPLRSKDPFGNEFFIDKENETGASILVHKTCRSEDLAKFLKDIERLANLNHPNILIFPKWFLKNQDLFTYTPFPPDLRTLSSLLATTHTKGLPEAAICTILNGVLCALEYLHSKAVIHRGVRAGYIFVDAKGTVRLGGFHHAIFIQDCDRWIGVRSQVQNFDESLSDVLIWLAPEVIKQDLAGYGTSSDLYSVGICLCEIANGFPPFQEMQPLQILYEKLRGVQHQTRKTAFSDFLHKIVSTCLSYNPSERMSASKLLADNSSYFEGCFSNDKSLREIISAQKLDI